MHDKPKRIYVERTAVLAKIEAVRGEDANPTPEQDAFLVGEVELNLDPQILERNVYRPSFSPTPGEVGRKPFTLSFAHEIKGSGDRTVRSKLGTLLLGCKMQEDYIVPGAATQIEDPVLTGDVQGPLVTFAKSDAPTQYYGSYLVRVVEAGASGTARVQVTRWNQSEQDNTVMWSPRHDAVKDYHGEATLDLDLSDETELVFTVGGNAVLGDSVYAVVGGMVFKHQIDQTDMEAGPTSTTGTNVDRLESIASRLAAKIDEEPLFIAVAVDDTITVTFAPSAQAQTLTSGTTEIALGDSGATIIPTWAGDLVLGQSWIVQLYEPGYMYRPLSDDELSATITLHTYIDGQLYLMTGVQGTVTFTGTAGEYGSAAFEFTGQYQEPQVQPLPSRRLRYELTKPPKVELAQLSIRGSQDFCAESFTITLGNDVTERLCMNEEDGYAGSEISGRTPTCTVNPEGTLEVYNKMWGDFAKGEEVPVHLRVGKNSGNMVRFYMDRSTYTGLTLSDRNRVQVQEPTFQCNGVTEYGDDELRIALP